MDFKLHLLESITNNFSEEKIVGRGGYGNVYKGSFNGKEIAIKKLHPLQGLDDKAFDNEFRNLNKEVHHQNVVRLIGYCYESRGKFVDHNGGVVLAQVMDRILCFEYMQGGDLEKHIAERTCDLDWPTCYKIIKDISEGLHHLHCCQEKPIFHLDLKPSNILLDGNKAAKISDLGLSKLVASTETHKTETLKGTAENWKGRLQAVLSNSSYEIDILRVRKCAEIALRCVKPERKERPLIKDILHELAELEADIKKISLSCDQSIDLTTIQKSSDSNVLAVDPTMELRFPFEPGKDISCCLQLTNKAEDYIAFKIKTNQTKYITRPNNGIMPPCSMIYIFVTLRAQEKAPANMQCNDMFLVQSANISKDLTADEITEDFFKKVMVGKFVDVVKLPIVLVALA